MRDLLDAYHDGKEDDHRADIHELVQPTLDELASRLGYVRAFVALIDFKRRMVRGAAGVNVPDALLRALQVHWDGDQPGPLARAMLQSEPFRVDDARCDTRIPQRAREHFLNGGMSAFAVIPLLPASGALVVSKGRPLSDAEINELLPYARRLSAWIVERLEAHRISGSGEKDAVELEWLEWMVNAIRDPVLLSDEQNNILLHNVHAERLLRTDPSASPDKRRAIELNNVRLSAALSGFRLDQGTTVGRELKLVDPIEDKALLFEINCQPATNLRTGGRGVVSVLRDVTDLRHATEEVQRSLAKLREAGEETRRERDQLDRILENVADPIVVTDPAGGIVLMNPPADRLLRSAGDQSGEAAKAPYHTNLAKLRFFLSQLGLDSAQTRRDEVQLVDPDSGELLTMSVTATEVRDETGRLNTVVSVLHDLTGVYELEQRRLEQRLFESEKLAAVGRLAAAVAHEINNPLEAIKNALYLVVAHMTEDDPNRQFLEIASKETNRVSAIVGQMLGFYRPATKRIAIDVNEALEGTIGLLHRQLRQHQVTLRCRLEPGLPLVNASPDQLKQVFLNLFLNAQESMHHGGTLHISTRLSSKGVDSQFVAGRYVMVQIRDTGAGIPEEHLPHIFEPFYSTKGESHGTGLGLWVSLGIIQDHGGQIRVHSRPGRGTTFTVSLPLEEI